MDIALISPRGTHFGNFPAFKKFAKNTPVFSTYAKSLSGPSSSLATLAALTPQEHSVTIIDENFQAIDFSKQYDLVGISSMTQQATRAYEIPDRFLHTGSKVVLGGIHPTVLPQEAQQHASSVVVGEGESLWPMVLQDCMNDQLQPLYSSQTQVDLTQAPAPRYNLLHKGQYQVVWLQTARGCPRDCDFCAAPRVYGRTYRHKTIDQILLEIQLVKEHFGNVQISFADDNFFVSKSFSRDLIKELQTLSIRWNAQTDISIAKDEQLLDELSASGCFCLFVGFESVTAHGLKHIDRSTWKFRQLEHYATYIERIQSRGIGVHGAFIVGLDTDTEDVFQKTADFIINNNLYDAQITVATPLPGTRLRERMEQEGRILTTPWSNYTFIDVNFAHPTMDTQVIENGLISIYEAINSREVYEKKIRYFKAVHRQKQASKAPTQR